MEYWILTPNGKNLNAIGKFGPYAYVYCVRYILFLLVYFNANGHLYLHTTMYYNCVGSFGRSAGLTLFELNIL